MAMYARYVFLRLPTAGLPIRLRFRDATVLLEITRDCSAIVPTWVLAARKLTSSRRPSRSDATDRMAAVRTYVTDRATGCRLPAASAGRDHATPAPSPLGCMLPTVAPVQRTAFAQSTDSRLILVTSLFGRQWLERSLRAGVVLEDGCSAARVLDAVVRLGYARRERASGRDL